MSILIHPKNAEAIKNVLSDERAAGSPVTLVQGMKTREVKTRKGIKIAHDRANRAVRRAKVDRGWRRQEILPVGTKVQIFNAATGEQLDPGIPGYAERVAERAAAKAANVAARRQALARRPAAAQSVPASRMDLIEARAKLRRDGVL